MKQTINSGDYLVSDIDTWVIEATSPYNDGWTQKHYLDMLIKLKDKLNSIEILNEHNHGEKHINEQTNA